MRNKAIILIISLFITRFIISCVRCEEKTFEVTFTSTNSYVDKEYCDYDTDEYQGYDCDPDNDSIFNPKEENSLSIHIDLEDVREERPEGFSLNDFGFTQLTASQPCDDYHVIKDGVSSFQFSVIDLKSGDVIDISSDIEIVSGYKTSLPLDSLKITYDSKLYQNHFEFVILNYTNVPDSTVFRTETILESGKSLISETQTIVFKDSRDVNF